MNNKDNYRNAFSNIYPSDAVVERIINMTERNTLSRASRRIIIIAAVLAALFCGALTVNAATGGELFDSVRIFFNGQEVSADELDVSYGTTTAENGETVDTMTINIPADMVEDEMTIKIESDDGDNSTPFITAEEEADASVTVGNSK